MTEDEGKLRQQAHRGARAKQLWENDLLQEAFSAVEADLTKQWKGSRYGDVETREAAYRQLAALQEVQAKIKHAISTGRAAETALEKLKRGIRAVVG